MEEKQSTYMSNGQQQFNLKWNNHTNNILQVFTEQLATEALTDITISCEGHFLKAHKMVLSACSTYFQDLFRVHQVPHPVIIINGMKFTDVKQVIDFMYRGEIKVLETEIDSLLAVAESLQVKGLCSVRNNYEKNDIQNNESASNIDAIPEGRQSKKRKLSSEDDNAPKNETLSDDESLSSTIKIEPPEIKDIDQEEEKCSNEITYDQAPSKTIKTSKAGRVIRPKTYQIESYASQQPPKTTNKSQTVVEPVKIPRPPNAFMIFANEWRRKLAAEYPRESNKEISVRLGVMWKNLGADAKENYYSASRKADEEHKLKYPGYYYSPKEARLRKNKKEAMIINKCKKNYDAMKYVKLVMKENTETPERWRQLPQETEENDDEEELSVHVQEDSETDKEDNSPEEGEIAEKE